jgi:uncharacterized protein (DUF1800 family)
MATLVMDFIEQLLRTSMARASVLTLAFAFALAGCGGGGSSDDHAAQNGAVPQVLSTLKPSNNAQATRFLMQAAMGPSAEDAERVKAIGYASWVDEQLNAKPLQSTYVATFKAAVADNTLNYQPYEVSQSWWGHAISDPSQLRQRIAFALSQIFVISTLDATISARGEMAMHYYDMLEQGIDGTYRQLLENVALHPAMGKYLSHLGNRKGNEKTGRVPDENFAREVMQLFSIGLYKLNQDGSVQRDSQGQAIESYRADDIKGMAAVMTGFSWWRPPELSSAKWSDCFYRNSKCSDDRQFTAPMTGYPEEHEAGAKTFLGKTIAAQSVADPVGDLRTALDHLASHPNVAPFISKQLIQRLVTSNPSPAYVADIASVFNSTGGAIKAVVKAILLHPEARNLPSSNLQTYGKVREPALLLAHLLRTLPHTSDKAATRAQGEPVFYAIDGVGTLGQTPLQSSSVFNFFRPGYVPIETELGRQGLVAPELQLASENAVVGYANFMIDILNYGLGNYDSTLRRRDVQFDLSSFEALANDPQALVDAVATSLLGQAVPDPLRSNAIAAITAMANKNATDKRNRARAAVLLIVVSPAFTVQQ